MLLSLCSGCRGFTSVFLQNEVYDDFVLGWRDYTWARRAFNARRPQFVNQPALHDFRAGFIDGYINSANGGSGCTPAMPPQKYWTWKYQSSEGQTKVAAWYAGYPHGARAAEEEGAGNYRMIQVSPQFVEQYERQDPNHPINRSFYENLPVPEVPSPDQYNLPMPGGEYAPPAGGWYEPRGSSVAPLGEGDLPPRGRESDEDWIPRHLPPADSDQGQPLPVVPPDEPGAGDSTRSTMPPPGQTFGPSASPFPISRIPMTQPAGWTEQPPTQMAPPSIQLPEIQQPWPMPVGMPLHGGRAAGGESSAPAMLPPVMVPQPSLTHGSRPQQPPRPTPQESPAESTSGLRMPEPPPALLQQPLGAPLFQSPDRR